MMPNADNRRGVDQARLPAPASGERSQAFNLDRALDQVQEASGGRTSVAIKLDQPLVADPEVMRDLMQYYVPDLAA